MHFLRRVKAVKPFIHKAPAMKLSLAFAALLLCMALVSVLGGSGTAYAASVGTRSTTVTPATSGGGCKTTSYLEACISENASHSIAPDAYIKYSDMCDVEIILYKNNTQVNDYNPSGCFAAGTHLDGIWAPASSGTWVTVVYGFNEANGAVILLSSTNVEQAVSPYSGTEPTAVSPNLYV